jgi:hypothetical protein
VPRTEIGRAVRPRAAPRPVRHDGIFDKIQKFGFSRLFIMRAIMYANHPQPKLDVTAASAESPAGILFSDFSISNICLRISIRA